MGYRTDKPKIKPEDMLPRYAVRNGSTMKADFSCYYYMPQPGHDPHYHDYINWPSPHYHDGGACQMMPHRDRFRFVKHPKMVTDDTLDPVYLTSEGYTEVAISFEDDEIAEHLDAEAWIDEDLEYWVHLRINTNFPTFHDKPIETRFTLFAKHEADNTYDAICHGILVVLPGSPYPES